MSIINIQICNKLQTMVYSGQICGCLWVPSLISFVGQEHEAHDLYFPKTRSCIRLYLEKICANNAVCT